MHGSTSVRPSVRPSIRTRQLNQPSQLGSQEMGR
jgi:hypothetical protein